MNLPLQITMFQDENVTTAAVTNVPGLENIVGSARRHPTDEHVFEVGAWLAASRLFSKLADHYRQAVEEKMRTAEVPEIPVTDMVMEAIWDSLGVPLSER